RRRPGAVARVIRPAHVRLVTVLGVAAAFLLVWWLVATRPHEEPVAPQQVQVEATAETATADLVVDVAGEVRRPGIVTLPPGSRVHEAIEAAGGVRGSVDTTGINLARVLNDGEQIVVGAPAAQSAGGDVGPARVNINSADLVALDALPGVGPVTAEAIIAWREENGP